jgi:hypothetical protein
LFYYPGYPNKPAEWHCNRCGRNFDEYGDPARVEVVDDLPPVPPFMDKRQRRQAEKEVWRSLNAAAHETARSPRVRELMEQHNRARRERDLGWIRALQAEITRIARGQPRVYTTDTVLEDGFRALAKKALILVVFVALVAVLLLINRILNR